MRRVIRRGGEIKENKKRHEIMKHKSNKAVSKSMREKALTE